MKSPSVAHVSVNSVSWINNVIPALNYLDPPLKYQSSHKQRTFDSDFRPIDIIMAGENNHSSSTTRDMICEHNSETRASTASTLNERKFSLPLTSRNISRETVSSSSSSGLGSAREFKENVSIQSESTRSIDELRSVIHGVMENSFGRLCTEKMQELNKMVSQIADDVKRLSNAVADVSKNVAMGKQVASLSQNVSKHDAGKLQNAAVGELKQESLKQESLTSCSLPPTPGGDCIRSMSSLADSVQTSSSSPQIPQDTSSQNGSSQSQPIQEMNHAMAVQPYTFPATAMVRWYLTYAWLIEI